MRADTILALAAACALAVTTPAPATADGGDTCKTFEQIFGNGKNLCEKLWDGAFRYVPKGDPEYNLSYTMWWFTDDNPNDAVTARRVAKGLHPEYNDTNKCYLEYFHFEEVQETNNNFTECHPWEKKACCAQDTVLSADTLRESYGPAYDWNRCGALSDECERFLVQEACLYECDPHAGLFRKFWPGNSDPEANDWAMEAMPIQGEYCDAFYRACKNEMFLSCEAATGSWFACEKYITEEDDDGSALGGGAIAAIVLCALALVTLAGCMCVIIRRERLGDPLFKPIQAEFGGGAEQEMPNTRSVAQA